MNASHYAPSQTQLEAILKLLESGNHEQEILRIAQKFFEWNLCQL